MFIETDHGTVFANTGGAKFDPSQPVAILVHGAGCDHSIWGNQNRYIAHHGASVLALDLPGHGRSGGEAIDSIEGLARFLVSIVEKLEIQKPVLIGHSMGALAVLEAAALLGDKCAGLGVCGVAEKMPVHPDLLGAAERNELTAAELIASFGHGGRAHRGGNPAHGIWMIGNAITMIDGSKPGVLHTDLAACNAYHGAPDAAAKVTCPTMLLLGKGDKMTPAKAARGLAGAIAKSETVLLETAGHMMMIEAPHDSRKAMMALIKRADAA